MISMEQLTGYEMSLLWSFFCGDEMCLASFCNHAPHEYAINHRGLIYRSCMEEHVISMVDKGAILPKGLSVSEWKVQIALGTANNAFILTELGARAAVRSENIQWSEEFCEAQIKIRMAMDRKKEFVKPVIA